MKTTKTLNLRKVLLAGTAIVAVGAFSTGAQAATQTLTGAAVWGTAGNGMVATPTSGDDVVMTTNSLGFDTTETGVTTAGDITSTTGNLTIDTTGNAGNVSFTIGSFTGSSTADITVDNLDASTTRTVAAAVTGAVSTAGNVIIRNTETGGGSTNVGMTVGGNFTVSGTGTTAISTVGTGQTSNTASLDLNGATNTFAGAVTVTGGANDATNDASLLISGASTTFTGGLTLTDGAAGQAILTLDGLTTAQTVAGNITGNGDINVQNAAGVTFSGTVQSGTVLIENGGAALNSAATFKNTVNSAITLGAAGTGTNAVTFDTTTQGFTVTGTVDGAIDGETNTVTVSGGKTLVQASAWGGVAGEIDTLTISGSGTKLDQGAAITADAITVGSGATLEVNAAVNGTVDGAGTLDVDTNATITGAVGGTTQVGAVDIANGVTLTLADGTAGYSAATTTFSGDGTFEVGNGSRTITGNFTNSTDGEGTFNVQDGAGTTAIVGNLGTSTSNSLKAFDIAGGAGQTVTTTGNLYVDAITVNDADTLSFIGTSAQTVSGTITDGILNVGDGTKATNVTFNGVIASAVTQNVQAAATARYNANATFTGAYTNAGTTAVGTGATLTAASLTDSGGTFTLDVTDANGTLVAADFGQISVGAAALDTDDVNINVTGFIGTANDIDIAGAATFDEAKALDDNSALYVFTVDAAHQVDVTRVSAASITDSKGSENVVNELLSVGAAATGNLDSVLDAVVSAGADTVDDVAEAATSVNTAGGAAAGLTVGNQTASLNSARLASLRSGSTGMAAGNGAEGLKAWGQVFGTTGEQDARDGISGYDVDSYGFAMGIDTENMHEDMVVGLAFSYADTEVDSEGLANAKTDIDSYQLALYGDYDLDERTYVSGQVSYMWSDNDTSRNPGGLTGITASGDYDAEQFGVRAEVGREYMADDNLVLTPSFLMNYVHYDADGYTETGAGTANLVVGDADVDVFELGVGVDATWTVENADGSYFQPTLGLGVRHDLVGDEYSTTNQFTGGGSAFTVEGFDPAQTTFDVGAGVTYFTTGGWDLSAEYNYEFKSDYDSHNGLVKAAYNF